MRKLTTLFTLALITMLSTSTFAQTADEIVENYIKVTGGRANWEKAKDMKMIGKAKVPSQGIELDLTMYSKAPNKMKVAMNFQGKEIVQPAFDGNIGWQTSMMTMKAEKMEAEDSEIMKQDADFPDSFLDYKTKGYTVSLEGEESVEGVACHKVKLTKKPVKIDGKEEANFVYYFFDKENGVPLMVRTLGKKGPMKGITSESLMSDYQEVNGIILPFTMNQKINGQLAVSITFTKLEINTNMEDAIFTFPEN